MIPRLLPLLLTLGMLAGCASPEERFVDHLERAHALLEEGRLDDARIELQSALKISPDNAEVNQRLGVVLREQGANRAALFHLGEAYRLDESLLEAALLQADLLARGSPRRAQRLVAEIREKSPDDPRVHRAESTLARRRSDWETALAAAVRGQQLAPDEAASWMQIGSVHLARAEAQRQAGETVDPETVDAAVAALQRADEIAEGHVAARISRARMFAASPGEEPELRMREADEAFRSAVTLARERGQRRDAVGAARAMALYARREKRSAVELEALRLQVDIQPASVRAWETLGRASERVLGVEDAGSIYHELIEKQGEVPSSHVVYVGYLERAGRSLDGIGHLSGVIENGLDAPALWEQKIRLELAEGLRAEARASYAELASRHADHLVTRRSEARIALADGEVGAAVEILAPLGDEDESTDTQRLLALAQLRAGDLDAAAAAADRAIAAAAGKPTAALRLKALIESRAGDWTQLLATLRRLEAAGHGLTTAERVNRVRALYGLGRTQRAREQLEFVVGLPMVAPGAALLYLEHEGRENPELARAALNKALRYAPGNFALLEAVTEMDIREGALERAERRLDRVVESRAAGPRILFLRAGLLARAGQLDRAEADALRAFEAKPELPGAVDLLFSIYQSRGKLAETRRSFEEAEKVGVLHPGARVLLARLYAMEGELDLARGVYEKVAAENPEITPAKSDLAKLLASQGVELGRATQLAEDAQRAAPDDANVADAVGFVYLIRGQHDVALQQFRHAIDLAEQKTGTTPAGFHYHRGLALAELGRNTDAAAAFEQALALDPEPDALEEMKRRLEKARSADATSSS